MAQKEGTCWGVRGPVRPRMLSQSSAMMFASRMRDAARWRERADRSGRSGRCAGPAGGPAAMLEGRIVVRGSQVDCAGLMRRCDDPECCRNARRITGQTYLAARAVRFSRCGLPGGQIDLKPLDAEGGTDFDEPVALRNQCDAQRGRRHGIADRHAEGEPQHRVPESPADAQESSPTIVAASVHDQPPRCSYANGLRRIWYMMFE